MFQSRGNVVINAKNNARSGTTAVVTDQGARHPNESGAAATTVTVSPATAVVSLATADDPIQSCKRLTDATTFVALSQ